MQVLDVSKKLGRVELTTKNEGKGYVEILSENVQRNTPLGSVKGICLHWTAGWYHQAYDGYHYNIALVNNEVVVLKTLGSDEKGQHLLGRNTGIIGISLCCLAYPDVIPTPEMLDTLALLVAEISAWRRLDFKNIILPKKKMVKGRLVDLQGQTFTVNSVFDHAEIGKFDYPSFRVDIGKYKVSVIKKARVYYAELKANKRQFVFNEIL